jgi:hypothetical protein
VCHLEVFSGHERDRISRPARGITNVNPLRPGDGTCRPDGGDGDPWCMARSEHGRRRMVHRLAAGSRLPGRAQRREREREHGPGRDPAAALWALDGRKRRLHRQLLRRDRSNRRPPGVRGDRVVRGDSGGRRLRSAARSLVSVPLPLLGTARTAGRLIGPDLRAHPERGSRLVRAGARDLRALHRRRLQPAAPCRDQRGRAAGGRDLP